MVCDKRAGPKKLCSAFASEGEDRLGKALLSQNLINERKRTRRSKRRVDMLLTLHPALLKRGIWCCKEDPASSML